MLHRCCRSGLGLHGCCRSGLRLLHRRSGLSSCKRCKALTRSRLLWLCSFLQGIPLRSARIPTVLTATFSELFKSHCSLLVLEVHCESKLCLHIRLEGRDQNCQRLTARVFYRTVKSNTVCNLVSTVICKLWRRKSSVLNLLSLKFVHLKTYSRLIVLAAHTLNIKLYEYFNGSRGVFPRIDVELNLWVVSD